MAVYRQSYFINHLFFNSTFYLIPGAPKPKPRQQSNVHKANSAQTTTDAQAPSFSITIPTPQPSEVIKIPLLSLVITLEIFQTLMVTGSVSVVILMLRYMGGTGFMHVASRSLCYTIMFFTIIYLARKWKKLVPAISLICYVYVTLHVIYITYKFLETYR